MLTSNLDISDRPINGEMVTLFDFQYSEGTLTKIYIKFDGMNAGMIKRDSYNFATANGVVPLEGIESDIIVSKYSTMFVKRTQFPIMLAWPCYIIKTRQTNNLWCRSNLCSCEPCNSIVKSITDRRS